LHPLQEHIVKAAQLDDTIEKFNVLRERCRNYENSALVPMGQELAYRYQEEQMEMTLTALRAFRHRMKEEDNEEKKKAR